ncbi:MAG: hypothetical protein HUJ70_04010 [Pseudobutyrivibrio sp.]|nr:hypothetical protein [Pseudobutyrivibrio sp.]
MENINLLKENVRAAFAGYQNMDLSEAHINEIIEMINSLMGKEELYEKLEELQTKNGLEFQLVCYFLPDFYLEAYYNRSYYNYLEQSTALKIQKGNHLSLAESIKVLRPLQEEVFLSEVEKLRKD